MRYQFLTLGLSLALSWSAVSAHAVSSTSVVVSPDTRVSDDEAEAWRWPKGVLEVANEPTRTDGLRPWFSEWPNDVVHFLLDVKNPQDLERVLRAFASIESEDLVIRLSSAPEPRGLGFTTVLEEGNALAAVFALGSQPLIDEWFKRLPNGEFGVHHFDEAPRALPPTLTLYVGGGRIDLDRLELADHVTVRAEVVNEGPEAEAIRRFIAERDARLQAAE